MTNQDLRILYKKVRIIKALSAYLPITPYVYMMYFKVSKPVFKILKEKVLPNVKNELYMDYLEDLTYTLISTTDDPGMRVCVLKRLLILKKALTVSDNIQDDHPLLTFMLRLTYSLPKNVRDDNNLTHYFNNDGYLLYTGLCHLNNSIKTSVHNYRGTVSALLRIKRDYINDPSSFPYWTTETGHKETRLKYLDELIEDIKLLYRI